MDDEVGGKGNSVDLGARMFDCRLGKFFTPDLRESEYPWQSTYAYYSNSPIRTIDYNGEGNNHEIKKGETLSDIAKNYNTTVSALAKVNSIDNPNLIYAGNTLVVPTTKGELALFEKIGNGELQIKGVHPVIEQVTPEIYSFTVTELAKNPLNFVLTYNGGGAPAEENRQIVCGQSSCYSNSNKTLSCDEFPYATTYQGGLNANSFCAPVKEQSIQGGTLSAMYRTMKPGDNFLVVPIPKIGPIPVPVLVPEVKWSPRFDVKRFIPILAPIGAFEVARRLPNVPTKVPTFMPRTVFFPIFLDVPFLYPNNTVQEMQ